MSQRRSTNQNKLNKITGCFDLCAGLIAWTLLVMLFLVFPLYTHNGYESIASYKFRFFMMTAIYAGLVSLAYIVVSYVLGNISKETLKKPRSALFVMAALGGYTLSNLLSFIFSKYKSVPFNYKSEIIPSYKPGSLYGAKGWYMGLITLLFMAMLAFIIALFLKFTKYTLLFILLSTCVTAIWGILNRYGIYPVKMAYSSETFVSTLGNVDWYCGYLVLLAPLAYGLFVVAKEKWEKTVYAVISFFMLYATLICGAESGILALIVTLMVLFEICIQDPHRLRRFTYLTLILDMVVITIKILDKCFPSARSLKEGLIRVIISLPSLGLLLTVSMILLIITGMCKRKENYPRLLADKGGIIMAGFYLAAFILLTVIIVVNTNTDGGLPIIGDSPYFKFNMEWGANRGACYYMAVKTYEGLPFISRLFGAGPDAFGYAAYDNELVSTISSEYLWKLTLTNAHNEILSTLVNEGLVGLLSFVTMWIVIFKTLWKNLRREPLLLAFIVAFTSYLANNMVSFRSIESTPLLYGLFGIMTACLIKLGKVDKSAAEV